MSKIVTAALMLGTLSLGIWSAAAFARTPDAADVAAQCREQVYAAWPAGHDLYERQREFALSACLANGGRL
jgi:hypothetical protein